MVAEFIVVINREPVCDFSGWTPPSNRTPRNKSDAATYTINNASLYNVHILGVLGEDKNTKESLQFHKSPREYFIYLPVCVPYKLSRIVRVGGT